VGHGFHLAQANAVFLAVVFGRQSTRRGQRVFAADAAEVARRANRKLNAAHILGQNAVGADGVIPQIAHDRAAVDLVHQAGGQLQPQADLAAGGGGFLDFGVQDAVQRGVAALYHKGVALQAVGGTLQVGFRIVDVPAFQHGACGQQVVFHIVFPAACGVVLLDQPVVLLDLIGFDAGLGFLLRQGVGIFRDVQQLAVGKHVDNQNQRADDHGGHLPQTAPHTLRHHKHICHNAEDRDDCKIKPIFFRQRGGQPAVGDEHIDRQNDKARGKRIQVKNQRPSLRYQFIRRTVKAGFQNCLTHRKVDGKRYHLRHTEPQYAILYLIPEERQHCGQHKK